MIHSVFNSESYHSDTMPTATTASATYYGMTIINNVSMPKANEELYFEMTLATTAEVATTPSDLTITNVTVTWGFEYFNAGEFQQGYQIIMKDTQSIGTALEDLEGKTKGEYLLGFLLDVTSGTTITLTQTLIEHEKITLNDYTYYEYFMKHIEATNSMLNMTDYPNVQMNVMEEPFVINHTTKLQGKCSGATNADILWIYLRKEFLEAL